MFLVLHHDPVGIVQIAGALIGSGFRPGLKGCVRCLDGSIGMGRVAVGNLTDFFAGGGIENRKCLFSVGYPFSIDIHAPLLLPFH
jgi:hypothetical protein